MPRIGAPKGLPMPMSSPMPMPIPRLPPLAALLAGGVPLALVDHVLGRLTAGAARRHDSLFARLGDKTRAVFMIDPTDLPFAIMLRPDPSDLRVEALDRRRAPGWDARIAGPLAALLGLVHGAYDGDALFFSRDLVVEGDTEAVLALRNAIDDAEIDLSEEMLALAGPLRRLAEPPFRRLLPLAERLSGVALTRVSPERGWR